MKSERDREEDLAMFEVMENEIVPKTSRDTDGGEIRTSADLQNKCNLVI